MQKVGVLIINLFGGTNTRAQSLMQNFTTLEQFHIESVVDWPSGITRLREGLYHAILLVVDSGNLSRLSTLTELRARMPEVCVIAVILGDIGGREQLLANTPIDDFILWPATMSELLARISCFIKKDFQSETDEIKLNLFIKFGLTKLVGHDPRLCEALAMIRQIALYDIPVLLCGETGTGKELFARAIHYLSPRASKPFMPVNCAAIPTELFENELFGHVKGAFTGAIERKEGIIQAAADGTIFLDEIDSISPSVQAKLLRFLEEKEYKPLGLNRLAKAEVRVVAAARGDLRKKIQEGSFRDDLFYRLNVVSLFLPPLRERKGDIPLLAEHFLRKYSSRLAKSVRDFGPGVLDRLACYNWPGNIRELENAICHAVAVCQGPIIYLSDLGLPPINASHPEKPPLTFKEAKASAIENFERQYIVKLLIEHAGNVSQAAHAAHKHRRAFWELMKKYNIDTQALSLQC